MISPRHFLASLCALLLIAQAHATTINVADFGATGNGVTDDRAAIQSAIDALAADPTATTLYFPPGDYHIASLNASGTLTWYAEQEPGSTNQAQLLMRADMSGRDIVITGQNARLYNALAGVRAPILEIRGTMHSLAISSLRFERNSTPIGPVPDQSDGLLIQPLDTVHVVDSVTISDCVFVNCHRAYTIGVWSNLNYQGKCRSFLAQNNTLLFPYGANSVVGTATGGSQMMFVGGWVDSAEIDHETADGMSGDITDTVHCPGQVVKDGWFFGSPMSRLSIHDCQIKHFSVEGLFQLGLAQNAAACGIVQSFTMPAANDTATVALSVGSSDPSPALNQSGSLYISGAGYVTGRAFDPVAHVLTVSNPGGSVNVAPGTVVAKNVGVYDLTRPVTVATITNNTIDASMVPGAAFHFGLTGPGTDPLHVVDTLATITGNHVTGGFLGIQVQSRAAAPLTDASAGSRVENNQITLLDTSLLVSPVQLIGIADSGAGALIIANNTVIIPIAARAFGIYLEGAAGQTLTGTAVSQNDVRALAAPAAGLTGYASVNRAVGYALGATSGTIFTDNFSSGFDVGVGPSTPNQNPTFTVNSHRSSGDTLPLDDRGPAFTSLPDLNGDGLPDAWQTLHFNTADGHGALVDDDHDGLVNLLEFAFNKNPALSDAPLPQPIIENGFLTLTIQKVPRVTYVIESAGDLQPASWSTATTTTLTNTTTVLKVRDNFPQGTTPSRFLRVRVSSP